MPPIFEPEDLLVYTTSNGSVKLASAADLVSDCSLDDQIGCGLLSFIRLQSVSLRKPALIDDTLAVIQTTHEFREQWVVYCECVTQNGSCSRVDGFFVDKRLSAFIDGDVENTDVSAYVETACRDFSELKYPGFSASMGEICPFCRLPCTCKS